MHNYGHFTVMQVRDGHVRGLSRHLRRLQDSSRELFGYDLDPEKVRSLLQHALRETTSAVTARVNVFSLTAAPGQPVEPDVMVSLSPPSADTPAQPWRIRTARYERDLPHIKHVGFFGVLHQRRLAHAAGFDDVLFIDRHERVSEGGIWNVGFWDGHQVVWPDAPKLSGITLQLLADGLDALAVPTTTRPVSAEEIPHFKAGFATYSSYPGQPLASVDDTTFAGDDRLPGLLAQAWATQAPEAV